jgi:SAM-dependent methyltransferase
MCVVLANLASRTPREWRRHPPWDLLKAHRIATRLCDGDTVLDIGCGSGHTLAELAYFRRLEAHGVDLALDRAGYAGASLARFDGLHLPYPDKSFDVSLLCYVVHHLTPEHASALLSEAIRVTRRRVVLIEDTLPRFGLLYRLRNRLHRVEAGLQYGAESTSYCGPRDEAMFLTHDGWTTFLAGLPSVAVVSIESLATVSRYDHHTLLDVELEPG